MRAATARAWPWPASERCRPGARPGRTRPVVAVRPWRTSTTVQEVSRGRRVAIVLSARWRWEASRRRNGGGRPALAAHPSELAHEGDRAGVVVTGAQLDGAVAHHRGEQVAPAVGAHHDERPVVELADAPRREVGVLGGEVGALLAALAGPGVRLFEGPLDVAPVGQPELEDALDVHLRDPVARDAVAGLEQLLEDLVVEGLGAHEPYREGDPARDLHGLARAHRPGRRCHEAHPDEANALGAALDRLGVGEQVCRVRVPGPGRREHVGPRLRDGGPGPPRGPVALQPRDERGVDLVVLPGVESTRGDEPAVLAE